MSFLLRSVTEVKTPRTMTSRSIFAWVYKQEARAINPNFLQKPLARNRTRGSEWHAPARFGNIG
jgi:hypothetical protein